ncbi:hypothetical protein MTP99_005892 [Tenebrio molitor]|nr:hypothetical protein MTP99_005892 [Tenebrio molitor]
MHRLILNELVNTFSSSDSSDTETETDDSEYECNAIRVCKIARIENYVESTVLKYTDKVFQSHVRMSRTIVYHFIGRLENSGLIPAHEYVTQKRLDKSLIDLTSPSLSCTQAHTGAC